MRTYLVLFVLAVLTVAAVPAHGQAYFDPILNKLRVGHLDNCTATVAPAGTDDAGDGYSVGSWWYDVTADRAYVCVDSTAGTAVWRLSGSVFGGTFLSLTDTPAAYTAAALYRVRVNAAGTGLEFVTPDTLAVVTTAGAVTSNAVTFGAVTSGLDGTDGQWTLYSEQGATDYRVRLSPHTTMTGNVDMTGPAALPAGAAFWKIDAAGNITFDASVYLTAEVDGSVSNEINTITAGGNTTTGLALTAAGAGIVTTAVAGNTLTITGTEADTLETVRVRGAITNGAVTIGTATATDDRIAVSVATGGLARFTGTIGASDLTADRAWIFPNAPGTVALSATAPVTLSALGDIGVTVLKDLVPGVGLSGGADDVLPGADADVTLTFDATELEGLTWGGGAGASIVWGWNLAAGDPQITFGNGTINVSSGALQVNSAPVVTDATTCTDIEGTGLTIATGVLNVDDIYLRNDGDDTTTGSLSVEGASGVILGKDVAGGTPNVAGVAKWWSAGDDALALTVTAADLTGNIAILSPAALPGGAAFWKMDASGNWTWDTAVYLTAEVDGSVSNEINTITGDDTDTTSGLAITLTGTGGITTSVAGNTVTVAYPALATNTTVNVYNQSTAVQIQAQIDAQPKNLGGYTLTFQFQGDADTIDNAAAVDKGDGTVGIPVTGHAFTTGERVTIAATTNYNGTFAIVSQTTNEVVITSAYTAETFGGTETIVNAPFNQTMTSALTWTGFYNGLLIVQGNAGESGKHVTQAVYIDSSAGTSIGLSFDGCAGTVITVKNLAVKVAATAAAAVKLYRCSAGYLNVDGCYFLAADNTTADGVYHQYCASPLLAYQCMLGLLQRGVRTNLGTSVCYDTDDNGGGDQPVYGLSAINGATMGKAGTVPSGSTADEQVSNGGEIR